MDKQTNMVPVPTPRFFDRQFFLIGAGLAVVLVVGFLWKIQSTFAETAAARRGAQTVLRATNPDLAWAFDESAECEAGTGRFAGQNLLTREACDRAVINHAKDQVSASRLETVFRLRDIAAVQDIEVVSR